MNSQNKTLFSSPTLFMLLQVPHITRISSLLTNGNLDSFVDYGLCRNLYHLELGQKLRLYCVCQVTSQHHTQWRFERSGCF